MSDSELERYIELYGKSVYSVALCRVKNPSDADDIMQDVFFKLFTYAGSFASDEHVKAWLLKCAVNGAKNLLASHWYRFSQAITEDDLNIAEESTEGLLPLVMKLSKNDRTVLYMHYYEGYPTEDIAKILGISKTSVTTRLYRGRKRLRKLIENERNEYGDELQGNN